MFDPVYIIKSNPI